MKTDNLCWVSDQTPPPSAARNVLQNVDEAEISEFIFQKQKMFQIIIEEL